MVSTMWLVFTFFAGAIIGRYLEKILGFLQFMRKDLARAQKQMSKSIPIKTR